MGIDWESILPALTKRNDIGIKIKGEHVVQCDDSKCAYRSFSFVAAQSTAAAAATAPAPLCLNTVSMAALHILNANCQSRSAMATQHACEQSPRVPRNDERRVKRSSLWRVESNVQLICNYKCKKHTRSCSATIINDDKERGKVAAST